MMWRTIGLATLLFTLPGEGLGHALNPGVFRLTETSEQFEFHWQPPSPSSSDPVPGEEKLKDSGPLFSPECSTSILPSLPGERRGRVHCPKESPLEGIIQGLEDSPAEVVVLWTGAKASAQWVLREEPRTFRAPDGEESPGRAGFFFLGVEHILEGVDHLLFCAALLLLLFPRIRTSIVALSAFTLGHALSMGFVFGTGGSLSSVYVENCISLSLIALAIDVLRKRGGGEPGWTERHPWWLGLVFGCIHGMGFAGAIAEIGVPDDRILSTLLLFNAGVEVGQVAFCIAFFALVSGLTKMKWQSKFQEFLGYTVGLTGILLIVERGLG